MFSKSFAGVALIAVLTSLCPVVRSGAVPMGVGKRFSSERSVYVDPQTGREVTRLTRAEADDVKIYQTHPSWTADGEWIVFNSNRTGVGQLFAVHEQRGEIVQLTDSTGVRVGHVCLSRQRPELLALIDREVVRIDLGSILAPAGSTAPRASYRRVLGTLPAGAEVSGTMSWDATETELYLGLTYANRPEDRRWSIASLNLANGRIRTVIDLGWRLGHVQANPWSPGLIMYCHETGGDAAQRMWLVNADGTGNRPFYRESFGEWVTHEIWQDARRSLFTVWPKNEDMRTKPHGIASVTRDDTLTFHSRFPYWHVSGTAGCPYAVGDTFDGRIFRVDLATGERALLTEGHRTGKDGAHPHPTMNPAGTRVLFNSNANGNPDLCVVSLKGEVQRPEHRFRADRYTRRSPDATRAWQRGLRSELAKLLDLEDLLDGKVPLNPRVIRASSEDGYEQREIEIGSTSGRRIRVLIATPRPLEGTAPAVVCIHGHGGDRRVVYDSTTIYKGFARELATRGFVTIAANVGQHEVCEPGRTLMGERLWDLIRCVDYLETLSEVDTNRIGCAGLSLGGEMAMWLGAMDERIKATVSSGFLTTMDQMELNHCMCWKFPGLRERVDYADIYSLIAPRALQCQNGLREGPTDFWDPLARQAMEEIRAIYGEIGKEADAELIVHPGGHEIELEALVSFCARGLGSSD